eukprot:3067730-Rhodomonas_salina.4
MLAGPCQPPRPRSGQTTDSLTVLLPALPSLTHIRPFRRTNPPLLAVDFARFSLAQRAPLPVHRRQDARQQHCSVSPRHRSVRASAKRVRGRAGKRKSHCRRRQRGNGERRPARRSPGLVAAAAQHEVRDLWDEMCGGSAG